MSTNDDAQPGEDVVIVESMPRPPRSLQLSAMLAACAAMGIDPGAIVGGSKRDPLPPENRV